MSSLTKTAVTKMVKSFKTAGFSASKIETKDGDGIQVWTMFPTRVDALCTMVKETGLEWQGEGSCWTLITRKADMMVPPTRRPFC